MTRLKLTGTWFEGFGVCVAKLLSRFCCLTDLLINVLLPRSCAAAGKAPVASKSWPIAIIISCLPSTTCHDNIKMCHLDDRIETIREEAGLQCP